jgi:hypothetical protein
MSGPLASRHFSCRRLTRARRASNFHHRARQNADHRQPKPEKRNIIWMKNRDPTHWRDAWQLEHVTGKYVISDKPMTEEQWIKERAVVVDGDDAVDVTPQPESLSPVLSPDNGKAKK